MHERKKEDIKMRKEHNMNLMEQVEALENALKTYGFFERIKLEKTVDDGDKFRLKSRNDAVSPWRTYTQMNFYIMGLAHASKLL
jgi:hypothetical protein